MQKKSQYEDEAVSKEDGYEPYAPPIPKPDTKMYCVRVRIRAFTDWITSCRLGQTPPRTKAPLDLQVLRSRYLLNRSRELSSPAPMPGQTGGDTDPQNLPGGQLYLPNHILHGSIRNSASAFKTKPISSKELLSVGVAILPVRIPLLNANSDPLVEYAPFIRPVPVPGSRPGASKGSVECGRVRIKAGAETDDFFLYAEASMFESWMPPKGKRLGPNDVYGFDWLCCVVQSSGMHKGVFAWRPSSPMSPGPFGRYTVVKWEPAPDSTMEEVYSKAFEM